MGTATLHFLALMLSVLTIPASSSTKCGLEHLDDARLPVGFCSHVLLRMPDSQPRGIANVPGSNTDVLVVERGLSQVIAVKDKDNDGVPESREVIATSASGLNHGIAVNDGFLYASSATTVFRWVFSGGSDASSIGSEPEVVMTGMNADGNGGAPQGHKTRTIIFDKKGRMYVAIGSVENVDVDSFRSRIRRFTIDDPSQFPLDFVGDGEVFADGLRNEVGLAFDKHGVLWGVENGADRLARDDLGGDIHKDNPAEEVNRFPESEKGAHFGYPYCFTEYSIPGGKGNGRGTVWAWPSFMDDGKHDDSWCRANTKAPQVAMQAHSAPLGIAFYEWKDKLPGSCKGAFPKSMDGHAFIAFHGSWNRDIPTGYKIVSLAINPEGLPEQGAQPVDLVSHRGQGAKWPSGMRPVDLTFDSCGRLLFTSDGTRTSGAYTGGMLVRVSYDEEAATTSPSSSPSAGPCCGEASSEADHLNGTSQYYYNSVLFAMLLYLLF